MYKQKYLKYKEKYLALKKLIGGFTYNVANENEKALATKAMLKDGVEKSTIDRFFYSIDKALVNKDGSSKVIAVKAILKNMNDELLKVNPNKNMILDYEAQNSRAPVVNDNLPGHLPDLTDTL
jgi:hypothetical protein